MVDVIYQQQVQLRQQRQGLEEQRRKLMSQQSLRQAQDRNVALQRQQQLQKLSQAEQQISSQMTNIEQLQAQQQGNDLQAREMQRQIALKTLVEKGKGSSALYSLPKEERAAIEAYASELKASRERSAGIVAVSKAEQTLYSSLSPELRRDIYLRGASGQATISLPDLSSKFKQLQAPQFTPNSSVFQQRPLFVSPAQTFVQQAKGILTAPVPKTKTDIMNIPAQARKIAPLTSLAFRTVVSKTEQKLKQFGIGRESPLFRPTSIPVSEIVGQTALGVLFTPVMATSGQVAVSKYIMNGRVYYTDASGQVIGSETVEEASKNIATFRASLRESAIFRKAGDISPTESLLREKTRELILKANDKQLKSLRELYKKEGRLDLFKDVYQQEIGEMTKTNIISRSVPKPVRDKPAQLTGAGQVTSQFAGTGMYERTEAVAAPMPTQSTQINQLLGLKKTAFEFQPLGLKPQQQFRPKTITLSIQKPMQVQENILGLKSKTTQQPRSSQITLPKLLQLFRQEQATRQQQRQIMRSQLKLGTPKPQKPRRPVRPRLPTFGFDLPRDSTSISEAGTQDSFGVSIEVRRRGRFQTLGTEASLERALRKGAGIVDIGLARSFRLRSLDTGELLDVSQLPIGFRRAKREAKTFVELPSRALSQFGEKKEIQYFKRTKTRRLL